jgi:hypothetical protein
MEHHSCFAALLSVIVDSICNKVRILYLPTSSFNQSISINIANMSQNMSDTSNIPKIVVEDMNTTSTDPIGAQPTGSEATMLGTRAWQKASTDHVYILCESPDEYTSPSEESASQAQSLKTTDVGDRDGERLDAKYRK